MENQLWNFVSCALLLSLFNVLWIDEIYICSSHLTDEEEVQALFHENVLKNKINSNCPKPSSCAELYYSGYRTSGIYKIYPKPWLKTKEIQVYCDMERDGGGWTVFQRRGEFGEPHINFTRDWKSYAEGFGNLLQEFWLGNDNIHLLTSQENNSLRIDLADFEGNTRIAEYNVFEVTDKRDKYRLKVRDYSGNAGEALFELHNNRIFNTWDTDTANHCARLYRGGWWYSYCHHANLNGVYLKGRHNSYANGINWDRWKGMYYSLKDSEMKFRPRLFLNML